MPTRCICRCGGLCIMIRTSSRWKDRVKLPARIYIFGKHHKGTRFWRLFNVLFVVDFENKQVPLPPPPMHNLPRPAVVIRPWPFLSGIIWRCCKVGGYHWEIIGITWITMSLRWLLMPSFYKRLSFVLIKDLSDLSRMNLVNPSNKLLDAHHCYNSDLPWDKDAFPDRRIYAEMFEITFRFFCLPERMSLELNNSGYNAVYFHFWKLFSYSSTLPVASRDSLGDYFGSTCQPLGLWNHRKEGPLRSCVFFLRSFR